MTDEDIPALLAEVERLRAENAAMREIVQAVAQLEEDWLGLDEGGSHGYRSEDVGPLVERSRSLRWTEENE